MIDSACRFCGIFDFLFLNHGWTQINTDTGICIRVYLRLFAVKNSVINDASHSLVIKNGGVHREVS